MNKWVGIRLALVAGGLLQGVMTGIKMPSSQTLTLPLILLVFCFGILGMLFVIGIQRVNPFSAPTWRYPSWAINPFLLNEPLQFFHFGGFFFLAVGAGIALRTLFPGHAPDLSTLLIPSFGAGLLAGVYACTVVYRGKMAGNGHDAPSGIVRQLFWIVPAAAAALLVTEFKAQPVHTTHHAGTKAAGYLAKGYALYRKKDFQGAIGEYSLEVRQNPDSAKPYYYRALAFEHTGNIKAAASDLRKAVHLKPDWQAAMDHLAWIYLQERNYAAARPLLDNLIRLAPKEGRYYFNRAGVRHASGDAAGTLADVRQGCTLGYTPACNMLARLKATTTSTGPQSGNTSTP